MEDHVGFPDNLLQVCPTNSLTPKSGQARYQVPGLLMSEVVKTPPLEEPRLAIISNSDDSPNRTGKQGRVIGAAG